MRARLALALFLMLLAALIGVAFAAGDSDKGIVAS